jgi:hypothetical protein
LSACTGRPVIQFSRAKLAFGGCGLLEFQPIMATSPKWPWIALLALQGVQLLSLAPWLMMAALSFMAFDAPGSDKMWQPWAFVIAMWSYPLWLLLAAIVSWMLFKFRRHVAAVVVAAILTLPALGLALLAAVSLFG